MTDPSGRPELDRWVHDLRNQLTVILGFSEILLTDRDVSDVPRADLEEIHKAATRAMAVLGRMPRPDEEAPH